jgi:hypothetical protein
MAESAAVTDALRARVVEASQARLPGTHVYRWSAHLRAADTDVLATVRGLHDIVGGMAAGPLGARPHAVALQFARVAVAQVPAECFADTMSLFGALARMAVDAHGANASVCVAAAELTSACLRRHAAQAAGWDVARISYAAGALPVAVQALLTTTESASVWPGGTPPNALGPCAAVLARLLKVLCLGMPLTAYGGQLRYTSAWKTARDACTAVQAAERNKCRLGDQLLGAVARAVAHSLCPGVTALDPRAFKPVAKLLWYLLTMVTPAALGAVAEVVGRVLFALATVEMESGAPGAASVHAHALQAAALLFLKFPDAVCCEDVWVDVALATLASQAQRVFRANPQDAQERAAALASVADDGILRGALRLLAALLRGSPLVRGKVAVNAIHPLLLSACATLLAAGPVDVCQARWTLGVCTTLEAFMCLLGACVSDNARLGDEGAELALIGVSVMALLRAASEVPGGPPTAVAVGCAAVLGALTRRRPSSVRLHAPVLWPAVLRDVRVVLRRCVTHGASTVLPAGAYVALLGFVADVCCTRQPGNAQRALGLPKLFMAAMDTGDFAAAAELLRGIRATFAVSFDSPERRRALPWEVVHRLLPFAHSDPYSESLPFRPAALGALADGLGLFENRNDRVTSQLASQMLMDAQAAVWTNSPELRVPALKLAGAVISAVPRRRLADLRPVIAQLAEVAVLTATTHGECTRVFAARLCHACDQGSVAQWMRWVGERKAWVVLMQAIRADANSKALGKRPRVVDAPDANDADDAENALATALGVVLTDPRMRERPVPVPGCARDPYSHLRLLSQASGAVLRFLGGANANDGSLR